jgi:putative FmdB family regulatory protein
MPTYDFLCADCGLAFEGLVWRNERPGCPTCNGKRTQRQFSPPTSNKRAEPVIEECASEPEAPETGATEPYATEYGATEPYVTEYRATEYEDTESYAQDIDAPEPGAVELDPVEETSTGISGMAGASVDQLEQEWRDRQPTPALDQFVQTMRREAPEIWDLERDFERRQADQLAEIGEKSQRLVKLMERIESLEPLKDEIARRDRELGQLKETVRVLEETERAVAIKLEQRTRKLYDEKTESEGLRAKILEADESVRQRNIEIEAFRQQINERDLRLVEARSQQATLERELQERGHRVEDANHERDAIRTELESRTAALFKRDEIIQEADEKIVGLRDELREREHCLADANQRNEMLRADLEAKASEVQLRDAAVLTLEERITGLDNELLTVRDELTQAGGVIEARDRENQELCEAQAAAAGTFELTQSVLAELKPIFESLEKTIGPDPDDEAGAALPSEGSEIVCSSND